MAKLLIFAGTTEGRQLIERLLVCDPASGDCSGAPEIVACVATEYGRLVLDESLAGRGRNKDHLRVLSGRLSADDMTALMRECAFDGAVDATHPYAVAVTASIRQACEETGTPYIRLLRDTGAGLSSEHGAEWGTRRCAGPGAGLDTGREQKAVFVESTEDAAAFLKGRSGSALLTTGSKELAAFTQVDNYRERLFARVLPMAEVVQKCTELGFAGRQLICMQGPFSYEMNVAMLKQTGARYLVTKETGKTGGFDEKLRAALDLGVCPVIIGRKPEEDGMDLEGVLKRLEGLCGIEYKPEYKEGEGQPEERADWFPLFININDKHIIVVGAGKIASRRIRTLLQFSCRLTVIASAVSSEVRRAAEEGRLELIEKEYAESNLFDALEGCQADYVLAATGDRECNHRVYSDCKARGIPVNTADRREESDFYFPGVARRGWVVVGITAGGRDHGLAKRASARVRQALLELEDGGDAEK